MATIAGREERDCKWLRRSDPSLLSKLPLGRTWSWDERAASHDIQSDGAFSDSFWHIARLYHRCRRMGGTEAPAESWFSSLKHGPGIGSLAERNS